MKFTSCISAVLLVVPAVLGFLAPAATSFAGSAVTCRTRRASSFRMAAHDEKSFIMIKPDGVARGLVGDIIGRFERRGYKLAALKLKQADKALLEKHYKDLAQKPFFPKLMEYMTSGPVVAMVWEGKDVVAQGRKMLGATNPLESAPGTIRGDFSLDVGRNVCHGT